MNNIKKSFKQTLLALALGAVGMASIAVTAAETQERQVIVKIEKNNNDDALVDLKVDGFKDVFSLPELSVGESKTITTQSGKDITITKNEQGLSLLVDGKNIALPGVGGNLAAHIQRSMPLHQNVQDSIQINGVDLDENQKQIIKNAFISAGIDKKLTFSKNKIMMFSVDGDDNEHNQFIIKKGAKDLNWVSEDNQQVKVIVNTSSGSDSNSEIEIHTIEIEGTDEN